MIPTPLEILYHTLCGLAHSHRSSRYIIPTLWIAPHNQGGVRTIESPAAFYADIIASILQHPLPAAMPPLQRRELFYLAFVRFTSAWDHDTSGSITYLPGLEGWRQTGTFVKMIALLPYLRNLGVTTIVLLPITDHGRYHAKGTLGSPYSPRNHTSIESTLAEPLIEIDCSEQFRAFIEASHRMGIRLIVEFALRVASLDCPLIQQYPEWFYWIKLRDSANINSVLSPPHFEQREVDYIEKLVSNGIRSGLPEPNSLYREQFCNPPVYVKYTNEYGYIGSTSDGDLCTVPNAFADYPPNDNQPLWTDITYFRLHDHEQLNYVAYNTVRYYDERLEDHPIKTLWNYISSVIPSFVEQYDIDGVLLDMGHAFPEDLHRLIINRAREAKSTLLIFEESFNVRDPIAEKLNCDGVIGDLWHWASSPDSLRKYLENVQPSLTFFATPDTHNTPRIHTFGREATFYSFTLCSYLPRGIPLITTGSEFGEIHPINTGLDFTPAQIQMYSPEKLPLFSGCTLPWDSPNFLILNYLRSIYHIHNR